VDIQLDAGTVLALTVGERPLLEAALGDDAGALLEGRGDVLGGVAPDRAPHEQRLAVLPLVRLAVEGARGGGDGEARDRDTRLGEAKLGIGGEVADDGDDGVVCHVNLSSVSWLARLRVATWLGPEVRDRREVSLPPVQWAAGSPRGATALEGPGRSVVELSGEVDRGPRGEPARARDILGPCESPDAHLLVLRLLGALLSDPRDARVDGGLELGASRFGQELIGGLDVRDRAHG